MQDAETLFVKILIHNAEQQTTILNVILIVEYAHQHRHQPLDQQEEAVEYQASAENNGTALTGASASQTEPRQDTAGI